MMSTGILITLIVIAAFVALGGYKVYKNRPTTSRMPLTVPGVGTVGYSKDYLTRDAAEAIARELAGIRSTALIILHQIYHGGSNCFINKLILDPNYHKPAEWKAIHERHLMINPTRDEYRAHFAEEIHNLYRLEMHGFPHIYKPTSRGDRADREMAQAAMRDF
jgi:hypothetical protein